MNMTEVAVYVIFALMIVGSIGWYIYGWFRTPPTPEPIPPEQISALRQEKGALLKEDLIYSEKMPLALNVICWIACGMTAYGPLRNSPRNIPAIPPITKEQSEPTIAQYIVHGIIFLTMYGIAYHSFTRRIRKVTKAALGDDARPTMPDDKRHARLAELEGLLKTVPPVATSSDTRS